ncbi:MAG: PKD domain-containing protein [Methanomicrobiales archaeon]|nr:PKD domain-containing protein [Methanomicrobiales archaeon]
MRWNILNQVPFNKSPGTITVIFFVFLVCAAIVVLPAGAANITQTISATQTTAPATSSVTTTVSATQTAVPTTSHTTTVVTTTAQLPVNPVVAFSADITDGSAPLTVQFADMSTGGPVSWSWDFGDGTSDTSQAPSHTYSTAGTYTVRMTATTRTGSASATREDYIMVDSAVTTTATTTTTTTTTATTTATPTTSTSASNLLAAFDGSPRSGTAPLTVVFTDATVGSPVAWRWDFGDKKTDTSQNAIHTYTEAGTYTVTLTVNSSGAGKTIKKVDFVTVRSASDTTPPEATLPGSMSNDYQVRTKVSSTAGSDARSGQVSTGKTKTPTPTLTGKAWLEYEKQRMAEVDAIAAGQQKKDFISQLVDFFKGLFPWAK